MASRQTILNKKKIIKYVKNIKVCKHSPDCNDCPLRGVDNIDEPDWYSERAPGISSVIPSYIEDTSLLSALRSGFDGGASRCLRFFIALCYIADLDIKESVEKYNNGNKENILCWQIHDNWEQFKTVFLSGASRTKSKLNLS